MGGGDLQCKNGRGKLFIFLFSPRADMSLTVLVEVVWNSHTPFWWEWALCSRLKGAGPEVAQQGWEAWVGGRRRRHLGVEVGRVEPHYWVADLPQLCSSEGKSSPEEAPLVPGQTQALSGRWQQWSRNILCFSFSTTALYTPWLLREQHLWTMSTASGELIFT